jgi:methionyl-tRNA formyltransferase
MKIGLFASKYVGYEISKFFGQNDKPLCCLVLDSGEDPDTNSKIIKVSKISKDKIFYSNDLSSDQSLTKLKELNLDLIILAWWPYILQMNLISLPKIGCMNFHNSLLPYNKGKHANFWTLVDGTPFGVTIHFVDRGVDTGDIAFQSMIEKSWEDTGESLYRKSQNELIKLFIEKFPQIEQGEIPRIKQDPMQGSYHHSSELENVSKIELEKKYTAKDFLNILRARTFPPYPGVWFLDNDEKYEIRVTIKKIETEK